MTKEILSFGAGVQSTTLLLMSCEGVLPHLDHVIFADTQDEPSAVYRHLEWCKEHAAKHGITIDVRTAGNLREDLLDFWGKRKSSDGKRHASIPAFIKNPDGSRGLVRRQCTGTYKIDVIERYVKQEVLGSAHGKRWPIPVDGSPLVRQWIGISRDELGRMKVSQRPAVAFWHPLIESEACQFVHRGELVPCGMTRVDCLEWISSRGYPRPPRSACIICPFRRAEEWQALTPKEFEDACFVDESIRRTESVRLESLGKSDLVGQPYLHSSLVPLRVADIGRDDPSNSGFADECGGVCGV